MRDLILSHPALNYLDTVLRARYAAARAEAADGEYGASAVEWVVITLIVLVIAGGAAAIIIPKIGQKATNVGTCIDNSGTNTGCAP